MTPGDDYDDIDWCGRQQRNTGASATTLMWLDVNTTTFAAEFDDIAQEQGHRTCPEPQAPAFGPFGA